MPERELPDMVTEMVDLTRAYVDEEVREPARQLGRYAGAGLGAGLLVSVGALLLSIAGFRALATEVLPEGPYWSALAYVITAVVLGLVAWLLVRRVAKEVPK
jgi:hypothetical protein